MNGAFYVGATGLRSQQSALDVIANNIANINTPAFKRSEVRFSELVSPAGDPTGLAGITQDAAALMAGVQARTSSKVFTQGELRQTGKPLDLAIDGEGFIELLGPAGQTMLWRGGALKVDADGYIAAENGMPLRAMISVPDGATALSIDRDGKVRALVDGEASPIEIGQLDVVLAKDVSALTILDEGLYQAETAADVLSATPGEDGAGVLVQGSVETSNVQLSDEMITLLLMQRAYAANAQVVQAGDQLMAIANGLKR